MIFSYAITTPANTPASAPLWTELELTRGVVHKIEIDFPPGSQGLLRLRVLEGRHQRWPSNPDGDLRGDSVTMDFREHVEINDPPFTLIAQTVNLDDTYSHSLFIRLGLLRKNIVTPWLMSWRERIAGTTSTEK